MSDCNAPKRPCLLDQSLVLLPRKTSRLSDSDHLPRRKPRLCGSDHLNMHFSGKPSGKPSNYIELPVDISRVCSPTCHCRVTLIKDTLLDHAKEHHDFNVCYVAFAIHSKVDLYTIKRYIEHYPKEKVAEEFNMPVVSSWNLPTFPILFYAVAQKDPQLVRYLCAAGADFNKRAEPMGLTLLAYTVISAEYEITDNTDVLATLLTLGANPQDIPEVLWEDYLESPSRQAQKISLSAQEEARVVKELNAAICRNLTLMQRYYLNKATTLFKPTPRMKEVAEAHKFQPLFETQFHIIGQTLSTGRMLNTILSHFIYDSDKPRVLLLTGMSGHGKTEIAKRMGDLLHLEFYRVDMTKMSEETDMFGPNAPYHGYEKGSVLNNFLTSHDNERCVVFLDEFEKTTPEVHQSMLLLLESGHYQDRRHGKNIDCKNIIWILAANLGEEKIQTLFQQYIEDKPPALQMNAPFDQLQHDLEMQFMSVLGRH